MFALSRCRPTSAAPTSMGNPNPAATKRGGGGGAEREAQREYVLLLADSALLELPLEALRVLQSDALASVSRDVSLQILFHKLQQQSAGEILFVHVVM